VRRVTAVIGNHQGALLLPACIASLRTQTLPLQEVIVADGGSTDESRRVAATLGAHVLELENQGLGVLYNAGVHATNAEYVLLSNNDVAYEPDCVELLVQALDDDQGRFAADARQVDWDDGQKVVKARTTISRGSLLREYIPGLHLEHTVSADRVVPTVAAHGAAMLVRRSTFLELGGFDETFFMDAEDLDLCWRAWLSDHPSVYVPAAQLRHKVGGVTTKQVLPRRLESSHHNMLRFALKCLPAAAVVRVVLGELLRLPRHPRVIGVALARIACELPAILRERARLDPSHELFRWMIEGQPE
jgi:GT2 family glycosyltransferase